MCGNGILQVGEECDDGNLINGDGCDAYCRIETPPEEDDEEECLTRENATWTGVECVCKDTFILVGTICVCPPNLVVIGGICQVQPDPCGNGIHESSEFEECDDGNMQNGDGCSEYCLI